ncbi:glycosyltransferase [Sphingomonas edaphi]|uniref:Glycosyltransferase n=1 Tax=Sphingomonas edaphi TaxID=2315689 RepID=A0A418PY86_9SPHN|nr:glycosyltransferase [Sphingomonas edaphi]RIX27017.1 glycosyltransferase [Sphingomonas edaphi]
MNGPERVLQIIGTMNRAGAETFLMNLYRQIDRQRFQFDFVRFGSGAGDYDAEIMSLGGRIIEIKGGNIFMRALNMWRYLRRQAYSVVHGHSGFSSAWFIAAARLAGVRKRFLHSHNATLRSGLLARPYGIISRLLGHWAQTRRLTCGELARVELHGTSSDVIMFPNCVELDAFAPDPTARRKIRAEFRVADTQRIILHLARLEPVKNHEMILKLAEQLRNDDRVKFITVGTGSREKWFRKEIDRRGLSCRLTHAGLRGDVPQILAAADVMILPSHHEGFPVVAVESQAAGLHCVFGKAIDPGVDCGLGLVRFLDTGHLTEWTAALVEDLPKVPPFESRRTRLASLNFDSGEAARRYENLLLE